ncbi:uncharacterized protein FOMMEDRAFT_23340 [Fomitiporia mediterranea MF3/22]|uniref:uncharacterized protein n=1 Tax=Fomitiporia mediterranea (strain MF3/22) TaxID=694068 RepID=UPI0004408C0F|nr:uncharacterized protein FOMMEDRAFT_23340 [Fomitiporia mediterranea MF3/22]EJC98980.1 hypothetical protein FOMMEDRAFT_23340 [Fomitiporia mediterranea MF3/22]
MHVLPTAETSTDCAAATPIANTLVAPSSLFPKATPPRPSTNCNVGGSQNSDSDVDTLDLDSSSSSTPARVPSYQNIQTPSTSSLLTDEHDTPAVPASAINTEYPPSMHRVPSFPMPPFSPLPYPPHEYAPKSPLDCPPLASPFPMYSPTSPLPLQIVHVPFAFPMYQDLSSAQMRPTANAQEKQPPRQHVFSQPNGDVGATSLPSSQYRSKPCRFFNEPGRCHKGNRCNFSHASVPLTVPRRSTQPTRKETKTPEQTPRKPSENSEDQTPSNEAERARSTNFYKINWRVVGGGVKIGTDNSVLRRRSEDMSGTAGCPPSFRNPFNPNNERLSIITSPLPPAAELRGRSHSLTTVSNSKTSSFSSRKGSADNALTLSLKTIRLSETKTSDETEPSNDAPQPRPIVVVQGEDGNDADGRKSEEDADNTKLAFPEGGEKKFAITSRQDSTRAKSSPSSPVTMYSDLSNKIFAAESP